jgi:hypothetical protein
MFTCFTPPQFLPGPAPGLHPRVPILAVWCSGCFYASELCAARHKGCIIIINDSCTSVRNRRSPSPKLKYLNTSSPPAIGDLHVGLLDSRSLAVLLPPPQWRNTYKQTHTHTHTHKYNKIPAHHPLCATLKSDTARRTSPKLRHCRPSPCPRLLAY